MVAPVGTYTTAIGTQSRELPLVPIAERLAIALLITVDHGVAFIERAGAELAEVLRPYDVEIVASVATMGIPIAIEVTRTLGLDDYLILQKTPKIHLADAISEPVKSITTGATQRLLFDRARLDAVVGRRVALVDDVVSTGTEPTWRRSASAALIDAPVDTTSSTRATRRPTTASRRARSNKRRWVAPVVIDFTGSEIASARWIFGVFCKMR